MNRDKLHNFIDNADNTLRLVSKQITKSSLNILQDGIERVSDVDDQEINERGYLVITPEVVKDFNRHLALKVSDDLYWTISASKNGNTLDIGILKDGKAQNIISFDQTSALKFTKPLELGQGLKHIDKALKKGIYSSGFKGFDEGKLYASGKWEATNAIIPEKAFGKYKLQGWLIQKENNQLKRYSHLETVFIFFPNNRTKQKVKNKHTNINIFKRLFYKIEEWIYTKLNKEEEYGIKVQENKMRLEYWGANLSARINKKSRKIELKCLGQIAPSEKLIYYTIERLWEGESWIEDKQQSSDEKTNEEIN